MLIKADITEMILQRKRESEMTWADIAGAIGLSEELTTLSCLGMQSLPEDKAELLRHTLRLPKEVDVVMMEEHEDFIYEPPSPSPPIYRLCEMFGVCGETLKELIQEQDSDDIFRAIDLQMSVEKVPDETGDYFEINLRGKFHPE